MQWLANNVSIILRRRTKNVKSKRNRTTRRIFTETVCQYSWSQIVCECDRLAKVHSLCTHANVQISFITQPTTSAPAALAERQKKSIFWTTFYDHAPLKCDGVVEELRSGAFEAGTAVRKYFLRERIVSLCVEAVI